MGRGLNSLDYLPVCYIQRSILTVLYVVCYQSVTRNSNISGYVYNREFITQPTPISHSPGKFKFWICRLDFFLKLMFLVVLSKLVSIICVTFNLEFHFYIICKYFVILKKGPWCETFIQKLAPVPLWGLYSTVAPLIKLCICH